MMREQCKTCVSGITGKCSLRIDEFLGNEKCGSYIGKYNFKTWCKSDFNFEYGDIEVDKLTDEWLDGKDIDKIGIEKEF